MANIRNINPEVAVRGIADNHRPLPFSEATMQRRKDRESARAAKRKNIALGLAVSGLVISAAMFLDHQDKSVKNDAIQIETEALERLKGGDKDVIAEGNLYLYGGVAVREEPYRATVNDTSEFSDGNVAYTVGSTRVVNDPLLIEDKAGNSWYGFTKDPVSKDMTPEAYVWVSADVLNQTNDRTGNPFAEFKADRPQD